MRKLVVAIVLTVFAATAGVRAQNYPSHPITIVVALPAGGAVDALARVLAEPMRIALGQPVIVENMSGAGGTLSIARVVRSAPDGYTIGMGTLGQYVVSAAVYTLPFDVLVDLTPVAMLPSVPYWMVARKSLPPNTLQELVTYLKANPDKISATSVGTASLARFCGMFFQKQTGTSFQFVPYRGGAAALQDLVGGQIDLSCDLAANSLSQLRDGNIKAYAVMSKTRWFAAPEVPTADEAGVPGLLHQHLAWLLGAEGHASGYCRETEWCRLGSNGRSHRGPTDRRSWHGPAASRVAGPCCVRGLSQDRS